MTKTIRINQDVAELLEQHRRGNESPNDTIRRVLGLEPTPAGECRARGELKGWSWRLRRPAEPSEDRRP